MTDVDAKAVVGPCEGAGARADLGMGTACATAAGAAPGRGAHEPVGPAGPAGAAGASATPASGA